MSRTHPHTHENLAEGGKLDPSGALRGGLAGVPGGGPGGGIGPLPIDAVDVAIADAGGYFTGTDVEAALQELGAGTADVVEPVEVVAISGSAVTLDFDTARWWDITLTNNCTLTITNPPDDQTAGQLVLIIRQGGSGSYTVTFPASVDWQDTDGTGGGAAPTLWTVVGAENVITLTTVDGGITWGGSTGGGSGAPTGAAGGDLSGTYPNPSVVDDSHNHTAATLPAVTASETHVHVAYETHTSDGSTTTFTLDQIYEPGSVMAWNRSTSVLLGVTEVLPDQATVSAAGSAGNLIDFNYAATVF